MKDYELKYNELINKYPHLEPILKQYNDKFKDFENIENKFYEKYAISIVSNLKLLMTCFEIALIRSVNQRELVNNEIKNIDSILNNGIAIDEFIHTDYTDLIKLDFIKTKNIYSKLVRGLEIQLIENIAENKDFTIDDLINTKAILLFKEQLIHNIIETQQSIKPLETIEIIEPTLKQLALYHVYLGNDINKDNANDYLVNTSHKSGSKLKQDFDKYKILKNRIYEGTDRNSFRLKLFEKVILMLKKTSNKDAILKAEKELIQFEKNIA
jgi:hypothetical protein